MQCERLLSGPSHLLGRLFFFFSLFLLLIVKVGWRDVNPHRMASAFFFFLVPSFFFFAVSGVVSFGQCQFISWFCFIFSVVREIQNDVT
jgi:hypothetical protein